MAARVELAIAHKRTFYDSLYLALAIGLGCELGTADQKLYNALQRAFPTTFILVDQSERLS